MFDFKMSTKIEQLIAMKENLKWSYMIFSPERKVIWRIAARTLQRLFCQAQFASLENFYNTHWNAMIGMEKLFVNVQMDVSKTH